jgi:phage terminase large subunit-like protein
MPTYPKDPATDYARAVLAGKETASVSVTLACQRHLDDLAHATALGLAWDKAEAFKVCEFFAEELPLLAPDAEEGRPFVLAPWERFVAGALTGWRTAAGHQRFRVAYVEVSKGSGKTYFGAGLLLYRLLTGPAGSQHFCVAVAQHQARLAFADAVRMVAASPRLAAAIESRVGSLSVRAGGAFLKPISSEKRGLDGKRVMSALIDEVHEADEVVVSKVRLGTKGNQDALILETTNAGFSRESVCWKHHQHSRDVLTGLVDDPSWFAFLAHLDACARCQQAGKYQPSDDCAECDDWRVEGPHWKKANPGLDTAVHWQYLREAVREALQIPSQRNLVRRLNFCQWTKAANVWLAPEAWAACADPSLTPAALVGRACAIGIDLSAKLDLSAVSLVFDRPLAGAAAGGLNTAVDALTFFWLPERSIERRAQEDGVPYPEWAKARESWLFTTPGDVIDHDAILEFVLALTKQFKVSAIGIDAAGATAFTTRLQRELGEAMVKEVPQGFRHLSEPSKLLEALVVSGHLRHPNNPVMNWCVGNLAIEENAWQEIRPVKISQRQRIDGPVSLILALAMHLRHQPAPVPTYSFIVLNSSR